jgi:hypothetical protein
MPAEPLAALTAALAPDWTATPDPVRPEAWYRHTDGRYFVVSSRFELEPEMLRLVVEVLRDDTSPPGCELMFTFARDGGVLSATVGPWPKPPTQGAPDGNQEA